MTETSPPIAASAAPAVAHTDALPAGARLHEFEIMGLLGVGGFGMVYRAYDHSLQRTVAIKEYMPSALAGRQSGLNVSIRSSGDQETYLTGLQSFVAEARLLAQFDHPSLVKVYRFWEANNTAYMVMPLYLGMTFRQARSLMQSPPPEAWLREVLWPILQALAYLHEHKTVHRDVSPDNIFLQDIGPPVLLDLGAARRAISDRSHKHTAILKVNYAPIEQYADAVDMPQGPWTDLYSLAAVVHGVICNKPPLPATFRVLRDRLPTFASVAQTVQTHFGHRYSPEFVHAIEHALAIQPQDRPQDVQGFSDEMALSPPEQGAQFVWRAGFADLLESSAPRPVADPEAVTRPGMSEGETVTQQRTIQEPVPASLAADEQNLLDDVSLTSDSMFADTATQPVTVDVVASGWSGNPAVARSRRTVLAGVAVLGGVLAGLAYFGLKSPPHVVTPSPVSQASGLPKTVDVPLPAVLPKPVDAQDAGKHKALVKAEEPKSSKPKLSVVPAPSPAGTPAPALKPESVAVKPTKPDAGKARPEESASSVTSRASVALQKDGPEEVCANTNFLLRPMCHFQECEKPEFQTLPFCVESRKRWKESAKANKL